MKVATDRESLVRVVASGRHTTPIFLIVAVIQLNMHGDTTKHARHARIRAVNRENKKHYFALLNDNIEEHGFKDHPFICVFQV